MTKALTTEEFIEKAKSIHGDKYDYSKTVYKNVKTEVIIIHKKCGKEILVKPGNHYTGSGCRECMIKERTKKQTKSPEKFIKECKEIHGDEYDYSETKYIKGELPVTVIHKTCGKKFDQTAQNHVSGHGCPNCGSKKAGNHSRKTLEQFINEAKDVHGDKYDYSEVKYVNIDTKVIITHKECGKKFEQSPYGHLKGKEGCSKCSLKKRKSQAKTIDEFIEQCREIHKNKYDYRKVEYKNDKTKVTIIHKKCGREFEQRPGHHLSGHGCSFCSIMKSEKLCLKILEKELGVKFAKRRPKFLEGMEYDCYNEDLKLALEYNSIIHFEFTKHFHKNEDRFMKVQERDKKKLELSSKNNINLIVVPYMYNFRNKKKLRQFILDELERLEYILQITLSK